MPSSNSRIPLKDIAREAGVSPMTVAGALRNHPAVNAVTGRQVRKDIHPEGAGVSAGGFSVAHPDR